MRRRGCTPETKRLRSRYYGGIDMKKAVSLMMAAAMTMGLAACGSTASTDTAASAADTASSTEAAASTADSTAAADGKVYNSVSASLSSMKRWMPLLRASRMLWSRSWARAASSSTSRTHPAILPTAPPL